jgi:hypothetical protein
MITLFVRSLRRLPSLQATLFSNASNIVLTVSCCAHHRHLAAPGKPPFPQPADAQRPGWAQGVLGHVCFAEQLNSQWACGVLLIVAGLALITRAASSDTAPAAAAAAAAAAGKKAR